MSWKALIPFALLLCTVQPGLCRNVEPAAGPNRTAFGEDVHIEEYPYMANLETSLIVNGLKRRELCSATVISSKCLLTAAHCIWQGHTVESRSIRIGMTDLTVGGTVLEITGFYEHPQYNKTDRTDLDVAIVTFNRESLMGHHLETVELDLYTDFEEGDVVTAIDYVATVNSNDSVSLRKTNLVVSNPSACPNWTENKICTKADYGSQVCSGDFRGPIIYEGKQVGISSSTGQLIPCKGTGYSAFTHLSAKNNSEWIKKTIEEHC